jgi:hypothetical protein
MTDTENTILMLLKACFSVSLDVGNVSEVNWHDVEKLSKKHNILPLVLQGVFNLSLTNTAPYEMLKRWKNHTISVMLRNNYLMYLQHKAIESILRENIPYAILKGASVAVCYPNPDVRMLGDIDILVPQGLCGEASRILERDGYKMHQHAHEHKFHYRLSKKGCDIELHYAVSVFPDNKAGKNAQKFMQNALEKTDIKTLNGYRFNVLLPQSQSISLLSHMERHMVSSDMGLRQLCDWYAHVNSLDSVHFQDKIVPLIEQTGLRRFAEALTVICVNWLGLDTARAAWCSDISEQKVQNLLEDILHAEDLGRSQPERSVGSVFVKEYGKKDCKISLLQTTIRNLNISAKNQFPIIKYLPVLFPFFWIYLSLRYWVRSMQGKRPKYSFAKTARISYARKKLYREFELFRIKKK